MSIDFYDTCALLSLSIDELAKKDDFVISSITLKELENIKTSSKKDEEIKKRARDLTHYLAEASNYYVVIHKIDYEKPVAEAGLEINNDTKILSDAIWYDKNCRPDETIFNTNDLSLLNLANLFFGNEDIRPVVQKEDSYTGFKVCYPTDDQLALLYSNPNFNYFEALIGQYIILKNEEEEIIDIRVWTGKTNRYLKPQIFKSCWFGEIKPYKNDIYQQMLFDSLAANRMTLVRGRSGSGKTLASLAYLMSELDRGRIDKIVVFCNTVATANSAKLGYYRGTRTEKLLDSQIGNMLASKLGGIIGVEQLIQQGQLELLPMSDIRGYDTSGMKAGVYITEAQNLDRTLMKLALQRIGEDCICIIDGDDETQTDLPAYEGNNNGMKKVSKVFRGQDFYGEITLQNIYRSRIADVADLI